MDEILKKILQKYKIEFESVGQAQKGYRNSSYLVTCENGELINLILYKRELDILQKIKSANKVSLEMHKSGLPVRYPIGKILRLTENYYACIYNYLPGSTIPWESYSMDHLKLLGQYLNKIHFHGKNMPSQNLVKEAEVLKAILSRVDNYFKNDNVKVALKNKLNIEINFDNLLKQSEKIINDVESSNKSTILHMDFVRGNILFEYNPTRISGILDFEKASYGSPLFDIARTMAFLIVDCKYKSEEKIRKYFLKSGYIKNGNYKFDSFKYLNELVALYLIYDFYKFLKHNPYEYLNQNEHFNRTVKVLKDTRLLL